MIVGRPCGQVYGISQRRKIIHEILQLLLSQRVVGLHRVATDGLDDYILAKPQSISPLHRLPAACPTNSRMNFRESAALTNGGSPSSRKVRSPNSLNPTPSRLSVSIIPLRNRASLGGSSTVSGSSSFCEAALPSDSIRRSICSYSTLSCAAC